MAQGMVFEDIFNVKDIDPNGKQFDRGKHNYIFIIILYEYDNAGIFCHKS